MSRTSPLGPENDLQKSEAHWIAAIGEKTRLAIIRVLALGEKSVTEVAKALAAETINITHHLGIMRTARLVTVRRDGKRMIYNLVGASASATEVELTHQSGAKVVIPIV